MLQESKLEDVGTGVLFTQSLCRGKRAEHGRKEMGAGRSVLCKGQQKPATWERGQSHGAGAGEWGRSK